MLSLSYLTRVVFKGSDVEPCLVLEKAPIPDIEDGEILGKILLATICGSDIHTIEGRRKEAVPSVLGHEGVITVVKHKRPDSDLKPGDRLTFHIADCCYDCDFCAEGLHQKCTSLFKYGHASLSDGTGSNGCYATHLVIRKGTHVAKIPPAISNKLASPLNCALATMVCATEEIIQTQSKGTKRVKRAMIQGAGLLGVYGCVLLKEAGYDQVYCSDIDSRRLETVIKFGAIPVLSGESGVDFPEDNSVDVVIEVCGQRSVVSEGMKKIRIGGTYILIGMVHPDSKLDMLTGEQIIRKCLTIKGFHNYGPSHLDKAVSLLANTANKYPYEELLSLSFPLADINNAVAMATKQTYLRVCIEP
ncbi:sorbitol dehydrogenase-like [Actinia tenebrosa]|uniref:Sorbitol dehydrogenase-like n=1 Tax=Actinia tenebrosa TaxID=6105 RepID=A0A6P8HR32_ACTTE|nr:sorbitol dehydrogenase-like [Actinia tenebrosa]